MEKYLLPILEDGGPIGAVVVVSVLIIGFVLRYKGWLAGDRSKIVSSGQLAELAEKVDALGSRVGDVEKDVRNLPTLKEIHGLELAHQRTLGRIAVLESNTQATKAGVVRIEDFLITLSKGKR